MNRSEASSSGAPATGMTSLVLEHLLPAGIWMVLLLANATALVQVVGPAAARQLTLATGLHVFRQVLTITFTGLIVTLFLARRPVIGRRAPWPSRVLAVVGTFVLYGLAAYQVGDDHPALLLVSSALILVGLVISIVSLRALDRCFGVFPEARGLVTSGPYKYARHPLYLGEIVTGLGLTIGTAGIPHVWLFVGLFVAFCVCQYWRARLEEEALAEAIPAYDIYRQHTWRIIPFIH